MSFAYISNSSELYNEETYCDYRLWTAFFTQYSLISVLMSLGFGIYTWYLRSYIIKNQQIFYMFSFLSSILLFVQSLDPLSLFGILSPLTVNLLADFSTWITMGLMVYFLITLIQVIKYDSLFGTTFEHITLYVIIVISFIMNLVCSILQVENPSVWRGLKLILFSLLITGLTIWSDYYFYKVLKLTEIIDNSQNPYLMTYLIIYHIILLCIVVLQFTIGVMSFLRTDWTVKFTWEEVIFPTIHLLVLYISEIFFLGKIKITL